MLLLLGRSGLWGPSWLLLEDGTNCLVGPFSFVNLRRKYD
jgi:hypothetical protein